MLFANVINLAVTEILSFHKQLTLPKQQILDTSKLKGVADNHFKFDKNGRKFSKRVENTVGKRRNCSL